MDNPTTTTSPLPETTSPIPTQKTPIQLLERQTEILEAMYAEMQRKKKKERLRQAIHVAGIIIKYAIIIGGIYYAVSTFNAAIDSVRSAVPDVNFSQLDPRNWGNTANENQ